MFRAATNSWQRPIPHRPPLPRPSSDSGDMASGQLCPLCPLCPSCPSPCWWLDHCRWLRWLSFQTDSHGMNNQKHMPMDPMAAFKSGCEWYSHADFWCWALGFNVFYHPIMTLTRNLNGEAEPEIDSGMPHEVCQPWKAIGKPSICSVSGWLFTLRLAFTRGW